MTFFGGSGLSSTGGFPGTTFGRTSSRTDVLGRKYAPFNNPFFDQASTYQPPTIKSLFGFCRYYYLTHGVINAITTKSAEYPITDIVFSHRDSGVRTNWEELMLGTLNYRVHQFQANLDYFVYGNTLVSPSFPFRKKIICKNCSAKLDAIETRKQWRYTNFRFWLQCPKCGQSDYANSTDEYYTKPAEIGLIRWNPENVTIFYNESTGRTDYALDLSQKFRGEIMMGRKDLVATTPSIFLEAAKTRRMLVVDKREVFHMARPALSSAQQGWGTPQIMPVLKDAFYMQVMKKAQETVLLTHLLPQIFLFPQPASGSADPFTTVDLQDWRAQIQRELARQRLDPSYYGIVPFPLGHQIIGDNGRQLLLMPEIRAMSELIAIGMGFPIDLVFGQGNYAGTSVSMRMLENFFLGNVSAQFRMLMWTMKRLSAYMDWPMPGAKFKPFKMADDLQRQAFSLQLNQLGKISDSTLLASADYKVEDESEIQMRELAVRMEATKKQQLAMAEIQGESSLIMAKYQTKAQTAAMEAAPAAAAQGPMDLDKSPFGAAQSSQLSTAGPGAAANDVVNALASQIKQLPPEAQQQQLSFIAQKQPGIADMIQQRLAQPSTAGGNGVDMRPQPDVLPPRRAAS
jgi:hypothetical protein